MTIRDLRPEDIGRCLEIYRYYVENTTVSFEEKTPSYKEFEDRVNRVTSQYPWLVAEENGKVIGYAYLDRFNERSAYRRTADLSVYVDCDFLHCGAGKTLYLAIEKRAEAEGIRNVISVITSENERSLRFHETMGFGRAGTIADAGEKFGRILSVYYYQKKLS